ncbi:transcription-repair-coupling factor [Aureimonas endophytica]|uniref:Transcription-repair-coupling factor n=1 Tax=Aureimonas endophytica TaxID=2027858 RepID=A0A917A1G6_9HYPH|nr:DEAD/DEAH box helicase [Aureimonas endophytica]GGE22437.1 transcription-repair-coupling factor [Aureimonas endophytica]
MLQTVTIENARAEAERLSPLVPIGAVAALLERRIADRDGPVLVYVAKTSRRRRDLADLLRLMAGPERVAEFAPLDGLPGDGIPPSAEAMGGRMSVLRWLRDADKRPAAVVTSAAALIRRVPPRGIFKDMHLEFRPGETIDPAAVEERLARIGYRQDERVEEPGEWTARGKVLEIFPAAAPRPCRIEHEGGRIAAIRSYDPLSQRSVAETAHLIVDPATEFLPVAAGSGDAGLGRSLAAHYGRLDTFLDYVPEAEILLEEEAEAATAELFRAIAEAREGGGAEARAAEQDYLGAKEWSALVGGALAGMVGEGETSAELPRFAEDKDPFSAFAAFAAPLLKKHHRIVIAGPDDGDLMRVARRAARAAGAEARGIDGWREIRAAKGGACLVLPMPLRQGFRWPAERIAVVALADLVGQRARLGARDERPGLAARDEVFRIGDAVVHLDHGVGILDGLEQVSDGQKVLEALKLRYADGATLLVPLADIGALWRYGGGDAEVKLDRLKGAGWEKRRAGVVQAISATAERMIQRLSEKAKARAPKLVPDRAEFERFCARFPYELTPDQAGATGAVLADLASGRPMDRLLCGDVGFGKTEVALRAAAAAVFAGRQVAVVAPTTILAQQHFLAFKARFERQGIEVVRLSRLVEEAEAEAARGALAKGTARVVVGSHALLSDEVAFRDLGLVVIDEEQRFGAAQKEALRRLGNGLHTLTMTATPIPQTLQAAFVGLNEVSLLGTPPGRRRPIRTLAGPFDEATVGEALRAEKARGGQSFVVCPRIEDLEPMGARLAALAPELALVTLHGRMKGEELDEAMLAFAGGTGDVLLATSIVESGLDVPNANTMVIWRADRFGLAQLHQLRGRVGRGARRGLALLTTDPEAEPTPGGEKRLATLCEHRDLGSGLAIAARDLDLRGTGDLLGEDQAGHLQLIGLSLYRRMLERALAVARGEDVPEDWRPDLNLGAPGAIPPDYVPEADLRIEIAVLLERIEDAASLAALEAEIRDRFGPVPKPLARGFRLAELRLRCRELGIRRLDAGSKGVAARLTPDVAAPLRRRLKDGAKGGWRFAKNRLVQERPSKTTEERFAHVEALLALIEDGPGPAPARRRSAPSFRP